MLAGRLPQPGPIGRPLHQEQHGVGIVRRGQAVGQFAKRLHLIGEFARNGHNQTTRMANDDATKVYVTAQRAPRPTKNTTDAM